MILIDTELCEGCGDCCSSCPNDCLVLENSQGKTTACVASDDCMSCGACWSVCPTGAIADA